jgi:protein SERAC1
MQNHPIVFVCHSLGGLVCTKMLLHSDKSDETLYSDVAASTRGIVFLRTPFRGSKLANWGKLATDALHLTSDINRDLITLLKPESEILFKLRHLFVESVRRREKDRPASIRLKCYFEEHGAY